jgi:hypothetical protein
VKLHAAAAERVCSLWSGPATGPSSDIVMVSLTVPM